MADGQGTFRHYSGLGETCGKDDGLRSNTGPEYYRCHLGFLFFSDRISGPNNFPGKSDLSQPGSCRFGLLCSQVHFISDR